MQKVLITGGNGFIGSHLVTGYLKQGYKILILDDLSSGIKKCFPGEVKFFHCDIRDREKVFKLIDSERPDIINHHAAQVDLGKSFLNPNQEVETAVTGSLNLLTATQSYHLSKFIFASSGGAVYQDSKLLATEESLLDPVTPYALAKLAAEECIKTFARTAEIPYTIFRYSNVYGNGQSLKHRGIISILVGAALNNQVINVYGDGKQTRDFIFIDDVVAANLIATKSKKEGIFNISTAQQFSINQIIEMINHELNLKIKVRSEEARKFEKKCSCLSFAKAKKVLSWEPKVKIADGLKKMLREKALC